MSVTDPVLVSLAGRKHRLESRAAAIVALIVLYETRINELREGELAFNLSTGQIKPRLLEYWPRVTAGE